MSEDRLVAGDQYLGGLVAFVYQAVRKRLFLIIIASLVVASIAYLATPRPSPIFTIQSTIRVGRAAGVELMDLQNLVARINAPSFRRHLLQVMNLPATDPAGRLISGSLAAQAETSDRASVSLRSPDEKQGRQALDLVVKALNDEQEAVRKPLLADVKEQIAETDANISSLSEVQERLSSMTKAPAPEGASDSQLADLRGVWLLGLASRNEQALIIARAARRELASRLEKTKTYPTEIVDDVVVSSVPASPRPSRIALLAGLLMFLGAVVVTVMSRRREMPI